MQMNKFQAKTISEATAKVRNELGSDAMILSTRKIETENNGDRFEITAVSGGASKNRNSYAELKSDLMSIKEMIAIQDHSGGTIRNLLLNPATLNMYAKLIRNGVNDHHARLFLERGGGFRKDSADADDRDVNGNTVKEMMRLISTDSPFENCHKRRVITALVGTTGVGKTTTIAKISARLMLQQKRRVGLISIDNYRIGAVEQLKIYAGILGIPCFPAFNRKDLLFALKRLADMDVVLIDTAGQSQYDCSRIEELKRVMTDDLEIRTHLLLSIATSEKEMERTAVNFKPLDCQSYIFTKTDESECCGSIINQLMKWNLPISYITTGQNVPEDIERATPKNIVKRILTKNE